MLSHLVRSGEPGQLLIVVNYRDTPLDVTPELADAVADLLRQPDVDRLRLRGLDRAGVAAYMEAQARQGLDAEGEELAAVLHAETAGNPFFLGQVIRHLGETGAVIRSEGRWSTARAPAEVAVPDSVRDVIGRRLARLPDETREILALAAVQGDRFDLRVLVEAAGQPQISVLRALDPAVSARLVTEADGPAPGHRFVHALVRHTLYDALPAARRMELHRTVGTALATVARDNWPEHAAELARHWLAATPQIGATADEARRTLDYAEEAARRAVASLAYEEAAAQVARALPLADLIGDPGRRAAILVALGEAQYCSGNSAHRQTLLDAGHLALQLGDGELAARAALANRGAALALHGAVEHDRVTLLEEVLGALGPDDSTARARVLVALAAALHFTDDPRRHDLAREAVAVARRLGDPTCLAHVLGLAGLALWDPSTLPERVAFASELNDLAAELGDPVLEVNGGIALYLAAAQQGDLDRAQEAMAASSRIAGNFGQPALRLRAAFGQASHAMMEGRFVDVEHLAEEAFRFGEALGNPDHPGMYRSQLVLLRILQGRTSEAAQLIEVLAGLIPLAAVEVCRAVVYAESGRYAEARAALQRLGGSSPEALPRDYVRLTLLVLLARVASALDDRELAAWLYAELMPCRDQFLVTERSALGPVAHYLGLVTAVLGRADEADAHFACAVDAQERTGARGLLAQTRLEWARLLLRRGEPGDGERARALAEAAAELAEELDIPVLAEQALDLLAMNPTAS
jgi:tetratricopeptide (TPR) repeat protein